MRSSLLFRQCPACFVRLTWMVSEMGGKWLYSYSFLGWVLLPGFVQNSTKHPYVVLI